MSSLAKKGVFYAFSDAFGATNGELRLLMGWGCGGGAPTKKGPFFLENSENGSKIAVFGLESAHGSQSQSLDLVFSLFGLSVGRYSLSAGAEGRRAVFSLD